MTIVDAKHGMQTLDEQPEAKDQVGFADRIFISKTDLVKPEDVEKLKERLIAINPRCPIEPVNMGTSRWRRFSTSCGFNMNDVFGY